MTGSADGQKAHSLKSGYLGGRHGELNEIYIVRAGRKIPVASKRTVAVQERDELWHISGGGAGVGNPLDRDPDLVREDVLERVVSVQGARRDYGVVIDPESLEVDHTETRRLRTEMRSNEAAGLSAESAALSRRKPKPPFAAVVPETSK